MKKLSTIGTAGIAALMAVCTLTGCMSKPTAPTNNESGRVEPPADIWAPYDQTVTVTTMGEENSGTEFQEMMTMETTPGTVRIRKDSTLICRTSGSRMTMEQN